MLNRVEHEKRFITSGLEGCNHFSDYPDNKHNVMALV